MSAAWYERMEKRDRAMRWLATAATWVEKATAVVRAGHVATDDYWVDRYLQRVLESVAELIRNRPTQELDEVEKAIREGLPIIGSAESWVFEQTLKAAEEVVAALRAIQQRALDAELIGKLENVEGRTPEEAAAFLAKAADLRRGRA